MALLMCLQNQKILKSVSYREEQQTEHRQCAGFVMPRGTNLDSLEEAGDMPTSWTWGGDVSNYHS